MAKTRQTKISYEAWYHRPKWAALLAVLALLAAYGIGSRSLHTGSWQQYFMTLGLLVIAVNRGAHLVILAGRKAKGAKRA